MRVFRFSWLLLLALVYVPACSPHRESGSSPIKFEPDFTPPETIKQVQPDFPESIRHIWITAPFYIYEVAIDQKGDVHDIKLIRGPSKGYPYEIIDRCCREAIIQWKFHPAKKSGQPIAYNVTITVHIKVRKL